VLALNTVDAHRSFTAGTCIQSVPAKDHLSLLPMSSKSIDGSRSLDREQAIQRASQDVKPLGRLRAYQRDDGRESFVHPTVTPHPSLAVIERVAHIPTKGQVPAPEPGLHHVRARFWTRWPAPVDLADAPGQGGHCPTPGSQRVPRRASWVNSEKASSEWRSPLATRPGQRREVGGQR
jgi:hypothetical protein